MPDAARFARLTYRIAAVYGLVALLPQYLLEQRIGRETPPPITHPEYFYGFVGVALVWQLAFLVIAKDPVRYRPLVGRLESPSASAGAAGVTSGRRGAGGRLCDGSEEGSPTASCRRQG